MMIKVIRYKKKLLSYDDLDVPLRCTPAMTWMDPTEFDGGRDLEGMVCCLTQ